MPQYSWNTAEVGIKHQSIKLYTFVHVFCMTVSVQVAMEPHCHVSFMKISKQNGF
jgi:hypothetical protein